MKTYIKAWYRAPYDVRFVEAKVTSVREKNTLEGTSGC